MSKSFYIPVFYLIFMALACSTSSTEPVKKVEKIFYSEPSIEEIEKDLQEEQKSEIHIIEKRSVVFFILSKKEAQILSKEIGESYKWETEALLSSFIGQAKTFEDVLKRHNISSGLSNNKRFQVVLKKGKTINFDREKEDQILGQILTNGEKEPLICFGMYNDKELAELIQKFFNIENLGYIPSDTLAIQPENVPEIDTTDINTPKNK